MKIFVILGCVLALAIADNPQLREEMKTQMLEKLANCAKEVGAGPDDLIALRDHNIPASHEGKCVIFCMHKLFNMQNDDGAINLPGALETMEMLKEVDADLHEKMVTITKTCLAVPVDSDPCVTAATMAACAAKEAKALAIDCIFE